MKRGTIIFTTLLLSTWAWAAEPPIEFSGVLTANGKTKLALTDTASGITRWVDPGAEFNGYVVARYDPRDESVTLRRAGQDVRLSLVSPKPPDSSTPADAGSGATFRGSATASQPRPPSPAPVPPAAAAPPPPAAAVLAPEPAAPPTGSAAPTGTAPPPSPGAAGDATLTRPIQPGETLETIARAAGITTEQLQALNPALNAGSLQAGQVIRIR